ncbi:MAG: M23 family metallopeptidase [Thermodesulfovibrionales bacterium]|nr:M23 family metallopeptidase [Thermodesulfovibrionales bacterium]
MIETKYAIKQDFIPTNANPSINGKGSEEVSKQIEKVFLNELLKTLLESTELGKNKTIGPYIPIFSAEMSDMFSVRGIGVGEFLTRTDKLKQKQDNSVEDKTSLKADTNTQSMNESEKKSMRSENISIPQVLNSPIRLQLPVKGTISSKYGIRTDPFDGVKKRHYGIDIATKENTEIRAAGAGRVVFSSEARGYGKVVIVEHENGISTLYAHNSKNLVSRGEMVEAGQVIALSGSSGRSTGPHLHFEVRLNGEAVDPLSMVG